MASHAHGHSHGVHTRPLLGKHALVTGATSGIGLAIARSLAQAGANVTVNGLVRGEHERAQAHAHLSSLAATTHAKMVMNEDDLTKTSALESMLTKAQDALGPVDILVNNAGMQHVSVIEDFPPERYDTLMALNLDAVWHLTRLAVGGMKSRKFGRIINIASVHGHVASVNKSAYVASKHAVVGLTKAVALETAGTGVTVNAICPGWALTPLVQAQIDARAAATGQSVSAASFDLLREKQPSGEFVRPEDLGALAVFLCGDAARQITGVSIPVDGGWTAQ